MRCTFRAAPRHHRIDRIPLANGPTASSSVRIGACFFSLFFFVGFFFLPWNQRRSHGHPGGIPRRALRTFYQSIDNFIVQRKDLTNGAPMLPEIRSRISIELETLLVDPVLQNIEDQGRAENERSPLDCEIRSQRIRDSLVRFDRSDESDERTMVGWPFCLFRF